MIHIEMHIHFYFMVIRSTNWWCGFFRYQFFPSHSPLYSFIRFFTSFFSFSAMPATCNVNAISTWALEKPFFWFTVYDQKMMMRIDHTHTRTLISNQVTYDTSTKIRRKSTQIYVSAWQLFRSRSTLLWIINKRRRRWKNWRNNYASVF